MKQSIFTLMALLISITAGAALNFPNDLSAEFESAESLDGWTISAKDAVAAGTYANWFNVDGPTPLITVNNVNYLFTNCEYADGSASDTWVISPEFTITEDEMVLSFSTGVLGDSQKATYNKLRVLASDGSLDKDAFTTTLLSADLRLKSNDNLSAGSQRIVIRGKKGEKMRVAFVNEGNATGVIAIADINVTPWYLRLNAASSYGSLLFDPTQPHLKMQMNISTPQTATGYSVVLRTASGFETTYSDELKKFNNNNASAVTFTFPDDIVIKGDSEDYTITITPNYEGVIPAVVEGTLIRAERKYPMVAVVEELTGTWCGWCPGGIAMLDYWGNTYGGNHGNRMIGIAIHNSDPMTISYDNSYVNSYIRQAAKVGMDTADPPSIIVNRMAGGAPLQWDMASYMENKSFATLKILDNATLGEAGDKVNVDYEYATSFSAPYPGLGVIAVVRENNVSGSIEEGDWAQNNYFASFTMEQVKNTYGEDVAPYFSRFVDQGTSEVPADRMKYQDVARGIYPSFEGMNISGAVEADIPNKASMEFSLPDNIKDIEQAQIVLMLIKQSSGEILSADVQPIHVKEGSVKNAAVNASISVTSNAYGLEISSESDACVTVYSLDGTLVYSTSVSAGVHAINPEYKGMMIVNVSNLDSAKTVKVII